MSDYLKQFLSKTRSGKKDPETRYTVSRDKWDRRMVDDLETEMKEYNLAAKDLGEATPTGHEAMDDTLLSLFKVQPHFKSDNEIRPSYSVNKRVVNELQGAENFDQLHNSSMGDPIGAGLAAAAMEPELEALFEKLAPQQQQAQQIEQQLQDFEQTADEANDLADQLMNSNLSPEDAQNYQDNLDALNEQLDKMQQEIMDNAQNLNDQLDGMQQSINKAANSAVNDAAEQQKSLDDAEGWGFGPGEIRKLDPKARLALADKLNSPKFKKMAEIFGRMQNVAMNSQLDKTNRVPEEIYDLKQGNDLARIIPTEIAFASDETLVYDFMRRFVEQNLIQYALRGHEEVNQGGIILLEDASGSMNGDREIWAKAIGLALLKIAQMQNRPFHAIMFAGSGQIMEFAFDTSKSPIEMVSGSKTFHGLEAVIRFAEAGLSGGTDFMTPLSKALDILQSEFDDKGSTEGDIVFLTDGQCGVPEQFIKDFKAEQERMDFKVYGVAIQTNPKSEPFWTICDGNAIGLGQLTDPNEMTELFGSL